MFRVGFSFVVLEPRKNVFPNTICNQQEARMSLCIGGGESPHLCGQLPK